MPAATPTITTKQPPAVSNELESALPSPDGLNITGGFALLTRASRRLFPLLLEKLKKTDLDKFNDCISLAEAFALGKFVYWTEVKEIVDSPGVDKDGYIGDIKESIKLLAESARIAFKWKLSEDDPQTKEELLNNTKGKLRKTYKRLLATKETLKIYDDGDYSSKWDYSLKKDFDRLEKSHKIGYGVIGTPIDPSDISSFGFLWPEGKAPELYMKDAKKLYEIPDFNFKTYEEFTKSPNDFPFVGYVYWNVKDISEIDKVVEQIEEIQNPYFSKKKFPPSFIVFTHIPLNLLEQRKLWEQGATIYDGQGDSPRDHDSLKRHLEAGHIGWYKKGNMWAYEGNGNMRAYKDSLKTPLKKN
jgi:hypothetical protein